MLLLAFLAPASFAAEKPDNSALVESIIQAQKAGIAKLDHFAGSAVVKRSFTVTPFPGAPQRPKDPREGSETYLADFKFKGAMQRVTERVYDPSTGQAGPVLQDRIDSPETFWCYTPANNAAYQVDIKTSKFAHEAGHDFSLSSANSPEGASFEMLLRNTYAYCQYWETSRRDDGMLVIKSGGTQERAPRKWDTVFVLNPAAGYSVVEYDKFADWGGGETRKANYKVDWQQVDGKWVPRSVTYVSDWKRSPKDPMSAGDVLEQCSVEFRNFDTVSSVDDAAFKIDDFNMPVGTEVNDHIAKCFYQYKGSVADDVITGDLAKGISTTPADSSTPVAVPDQPDKPVEKPSTTAAEPGGLSTAAIWAISVFGAVCVIIAVVVALRLRARK